jgi:hypothetical protein
LSFSTLAKNAAKDVMIQTAPGFLVKLFDWLIVTNGRLVMKGRPRAGPTVSMKPKNADHIRIDF